MKIARICFLIIMIILATIARVNAASDLKQAMILTTLTEASLSVFSMLQEREHGSLENLSWTADYSERDWVYHAHGKYNGKDLEFTLAGFLWGEDKQDLIISYAGLGRFGDESLQVHGRTTWLYDQARDDYREMDFQQNFKLGENSVWGWVIGAEVIVGGTIGAGAAIVGGTIVTGGLGLGAAVWLGMGGFASGSAAFVCASAAAESLLESEEPPEPPTPPKRPEPPKADQTLVATKGMIYTAVSGNGQIAGSDLTARYITVGSFEEGKAEGSITVIKK